MSTSSSRPVVIVDDEKSYVDLLAQLLGNFLLCEIKTFTDPRDALAAMPALNPGVVVTDYSMPEMNGFEFVEEGQTTVPGVPFIIISGHVLDLDPAEYAHLPALKEILPKPFRWADLAKTIIQHWPDDNPPSRK